MSPSAESTPPEDKEPMKDPRPSTWTRDRDETARRTVCAVLSRTSHLLHAQYRVDSDSTVSIMTGQALQKDLKLAQQMIPHSPFRDFVDQASSALATGNAPAGDAFIWLDLIALEVSFTIPNDPT